MRTLLTTLAVVLGLGFGVAQAATPAHGPADPLAGLDISIAEKPVLADLYPPRRTIFKGGAVGLADVVYATVPGFRPLTLDLYLPPKASDKAVHPLIIYVHGGGWVAGHSRHNGAINHYPDFLASLARRGYVVASLTYRLDGEAPFPAQIDDVRSAIIWLKTHAADYGINKDKVGVWGGSAGGHLIGLAAVSCDVTFDAEIPPATASATDTPTPCVQAAVGWYGVYDFQTMAAQRQLNAPAASQPAPDADAAIMKLLNCHPATCDAAEAKASPVTYVDKTDPPMLLIAGADDHTVPHQQSEEMDARLKAAGVSSQLIILPGVDHSFIGTTPEATRDATLKALAATITFFDKQLK